MKKIAVVGNVSLDILFEAPRMPHQHEKLQAEHMTIAGGGAPANVAHWLARLGHEVRFFSVTGNDPLSDLAVESLRTAGVDITNVRRIAGVGPSVCAIVTQGSHKSMVCGSPAAATLAHWAAMLNEADFSTYDHVHIMPRLHSPLFAGGRRGDLAGRTISTDLNGSYSPQLVADIDFAFSNYDEISAKSCRRDIDAMIAADLAGRPHHLLVTRGADEIVCYRAGETLRVIPRSVATLDRTGGGDAFCAGYLHKILQGAEPADAINAGLTLAQATLQAFGGRPATSTINTALATLTGKRTPPTTTGS